MLEKQLLERLITKRVLLQQARSTGLRVPDAELDQAIERIAAQNKLSADGLRQAVAQTGVSFDRFREDVRGEILISRLREREVESRVVVTDAEIQTFLRSQEGRGQQADEYSLAHILVSVPEQATPEELRLRRTRAETALAQLKSGADFRQVAASFSDAPDALQGGEMGWRPAGRLPSIFLEALRTMKVGEVSPILRSPAGFHIVKLDNLRGSNAAVIVTQTHARHILVRLNEVVSEADARNRLTELKYRVDNGGDFAELARLHSDDASAARGGDLGWLSPGDTVPEFERAMDAAQAQAGQRAVPEPVWLAHRPGHGAARAGHVPGPAAADRPPGDSLAQVGRAMGRLGPAAARQGLHRVSARNALSSKCIGRGGALAPA